MRLCDDGHDEVCYEVKHCPVCDMLEEITRYQKEIEELNGTIERLIDDSRKDT